MLEAVGNPGSWFAKIGNDRYPCVHKERITGSDYSDPTIVPGERRRADAFVEAIRKDRKVIVQTGLKNRKSYVALYAVADVACDEHGLRFRIVEFIDEVARPQKKAQSGSASPTEVMRSAAA